MVIRPAHVADAPEICSLINYHAERGRMLHRSLESAYSSLREFLVAVRGRKVIGCVAISIFWSNLAEIKSLAVAKEYLGKGVGHKLIQAAVAEARRLGIKRLFALTYELNFFLRQGFVEIDRETLPEKVWRECINCAKADACDEHAVWLSLSGRNRRTSKAPAARRQRKA